MGTVLVSGGASGIGAEVIRLLARDGHDVIVADIDPAGQQVAEQVDGRFLLLDVGDSESWRQVPNVDFAVLNAGVLSGPSPCSPDLWTDELWGRLRSVNIDGAVLGLRTVLPAMLKRNEGAVVLTASTSGLSPLPTDPLYSGSKHFVVGMMRSLAIQLRETRVRVMALCPGATDTPILTPNKRTGLELLRPEDVAASIVDLLENGETGTALAVTVGGAVPWNFVDVPADFRPGVKAQGLS